VSNADPIRPVLLRRRVWRPTACCYGGARRCCAEVARCPNRVRLARSASTSRLDRRLRSSGGENPSVTGIGGPGPLDGQPPVSNARAGAARRVRQPVVPAARAPSAEAKPRSSNRPRTSFLSCGQIDSSASDRLARRRRRCRRGARHGCRRPRELVMIRCSPARAAWTSSTGAVGCRSETMCPLRTGRPGVDTGSSQAARPAARGSPQAGRRARGSTARPIPVSSLMDASSPEAALYDIVDSSNRRASRRARVPAV
jgi:hypothetical protein